MRFLQRSSNGELTLTKDLVGEDSIPPYAILSHTWGTDEEEVTFEDFTNGTGKNKAGYKKILFCSEQARKDNLHYFWVDSCCINKANYTELSQAINSMFRWYGDAARCYVYLSDVSEPDLTASEDCTLTSWEASFRSCRWLKRGWTLQELLAPHMVEFFSWNGMRLGDKKSLGRHIYEVAGIPDSAIQGAPLSNFSVEERLSWIERRQTKLEEDRAYSLLGIFGVHMPLIYGEGGENAFRRLREEIDKPIKSLLHQQTPIQMNKEDQECIKNLRLTDPRDDKKRIEDTKGGLVKDSYNWILNNPDFCHWRDHEQSRLLWIKGDPGKGKTMLLCGILDELKKSEATLSFFFCQATDSRINTATAVLRGLLYMLVDQQPSLISHIRKKYDPVGKALFEDVNAWVALTEIFASILQDQNLGSAYLIIDALDECVSNLPKLLEFIAQHSSPRVKWVVSSRNWPEIEEQLERVDDVVRLSLELNAESVSTAVSIFIEQKVSQLAQQKKYDDRTRDAVRDHLLLNAHNTFLWVALVCQSLEQIPRWTVRAKLHVFPPSLDLLYTQMMQQVYRSDNADLYKNILALMASVYRPITLRELASLVPLLEDISDDLESLREIVSLCGSFLTVQEDIVYFIHQSAKDFLTTKASKEVFPFSRECTHRIIFLRSLQILSNTLRRDIYGLNAVGYSIKKIKQLDPNLDPLAALRYSCVYWIDHLYDSGSAPLMNSTGDIHDRVTISTFLKEKYLYWLEALSLCKSISKGVVSMAKLAELVQGTADEALVEIVQDAHRFIMYHKGAIESSPLQAYVSALLFSPACSLIRRLFKHEEPDWITIKPAMKDRWSACLQTLEGHSSTVCAVSFSSDSTRLASASSDRTIKIWNVSSGTCEHTLKGHRSSIWSVVFSHDLTQLASASNDRTIKIWNVSSGACQQTLEGHNYDVQSVIFSYDSTRLASASGRTIKIWNMGNGVCEQTLENNSLVRCVAFPHDSNLLASALSDGTIKIWKVSSGTCEQTLKGSSPVRSANFSQDSTKLASALENGTIKIWNVSTGACEQTLDSHSDFVRSVAFSHNSTRLASATDSKTIKIWNLGNGICEQTLEGHSDWVRSVAFSYNSTRLASASNDKTIKIWDVSNSTCEQAVEGHGDWVSSLVFSHDSKRLASASDDMTVKIWTVSSGICEKTLKGHNDWVSSVAFSHDSTWLVSASDSTVKIWNVDSGACEQTLNNHSLVRSVAFSHDSTRLASASDNGTLKIWNVGSGMCERTLEGHSLVRSMVFSHDSTLLASASNYKTVKIWNMTNGECEQTLNTGKELSELSFNGNNSFFHTNTGPITTSTSSFTSTTNIAKPQHSQNQGGAVNLDREWIIYNAQNIVWLPSEYRASCSAVLGNKIGIAVGYGRVWICNFHLDKFEASRSAC